MKLKNEPYRCGECKLENRILKCNNKGNYLKDSLGNHIYDTFTSHSTEQMLAHLEISHGPNITDGTGYGQCFDCLYYYKLSNLPIVYRELVKLCYDCAQHRCAGYGNMRASIWRILKENNVPFEKIISDDELLQELKKLLSSQK